MSIFRKSIILQFKQVSLFSYTDLRGQSFTEDGGIKSSDMYYIFSIIFI